MDFPRLKVSPRLIVELIATGGRLNLDNLRPTLTELMSDVDCGTTQLFPRPDWQWFSHFFGDCARPQNPTARGRPPDSSSASAGFNASDLRALINFDFVLPTSCRRFVKRDHRDELARPFSCAAQYPQTSIFGV